jgi:hypothetical protein
VAIILRHHATPTYGDWVSDEGEQWSTAVEYITVRDRISQKNAR